MIMSEYDRIMAIVRTKEYRDDLKAFVKGKVTEDEIKLKWNIGTIYDREKLKYEDKEGPEILESYHKAYWAIEELGFGRGALKAKEIKRIKDCLSQIETQEPYIILKINLSSDKKDIIEAFNNTLMAYTLYLDPKNPQDKRLRELTCDPWKVWDMYQEEKNLAEVTRRYFNKQGVPGHHFDESLYKEIRRAFNKANNILSHVSNEFTSG